MPDNYDIIVYIKRVIRDEAVGLPAGLPNYGGLQDIEEYFFNAVIA